ncbi:Potassium transporter 26 [Camellia lanceoleosa]|uniref:Potassium transporter 26 n=1 Tax=Camellia lanceoleosa TaxID=1840588 RepID=A0ACC0H833_9ERIC|nr:Potassium transporter 26 [Camellia lanceoleosa]
MEDTKLSNGVGVEGDIETGSIGVKVVEEYHSVQTLLLAYQSLGIVYGDLGTSPLYVFSSIRLSNPGEEDLLGIFSLIFWTITWIALIKYVFIVLRADDHGEGGTFALYSFLCRHINFQSKLTIQNTRLDSDAKMKYYTLGSRMKSKTKELLERSLVAQSFLSFVVLLGTCMVIGDGALTPATSVLSALQGIQSVSSSITQKHVIIMAVVLLVALFIFQQCGTSKVSFSFSPIMLMWFGSNIAIELYNIVKYDPSVFKALSPHYIIIFFSRNGVTGWTLLGAIFLCITVGFLFIRLPSASHHLRGEAAYLIKHPHQIGNAFYSSIPEPVCWPMFVVSTLAAIVASQSMISATFSIVKQSLALGCFLGLTWCGGCLGDDHNNLLDNPSDAGDLGHKSHPCLWLFHDFCHNRRCVHDILAQQSPSRRLGTIAISAFFLTVMLSWTYRRSQKSIYEAQQKMSFVNSTTTLSSASVQRPQGICFFCTDLVNGIPPIIRRYIHHHELCLQRNHGDCHSEDSARSQLSSGGEVGGGKLGLGGVYRCLVQFGYKDLPSMEGDDYVSSVVLETLRAG